MNRKLLFLLCLGVFIFQFSKAQVSPYYKGGLKVEFDEEGKKYLRIISWAQVQGVYQDEVPEDESNLDFNLRRARVLMFSQINEKFLILTHFGLNNLNSNTMSPTGTGAGSQLFFHDVFAQYNLNENHSVGGGLHYFNGISRLNNQSTLNMLTLDNNRQSWSTLGLTDQFARHVGVYAKGKFGKLQYRVAINDAMTSSLDLRDPEVGGNAVYGGRRLLGSKDAGKAYAGYFDFHFFDQESNFLPYKVGTYLGNKKIFNIGAGFFVHPNGAVYVDNNGELSGDNVSIFAVDAFYDTPLGTNGSALTAYATYQNNNYGENYLYSAYGTGSMLYSHIGYLLPGENTKTQFQPYLAYGMNSYDALDDNRNILKAGLNLFLSSHNSKLSLEYLNEDFGNVNQNLVTLQAMIYL